MNSSADQPLASSNTQRDSSGGGTQGTVLKQLGPGLITGAADDDPSGIATYSQAGAQFGFNMLWTLLLTYPLMSAIQLISARIGRVTGCGLAANIGAIWPRPLVVALVVLLFAANTINIGANLTAMGASVELATGIPSLPATMVFALLSLLLQMFIPYERYARYLKWLTLVLISYVAVLFVVKIDWTSALKGFLWPSFPVSGDSFTVIVAILGTTISPYLFFWQSSQEVEEIDRKDTAEPRQRVDRLPACMMNWIIEACAFDGIFLVLPRTAGWPIWRRSASRIFVIRRSCRSRVRTCPVPSAILPRCLPSPILAATSPTATMIRLR
jgi:NRAMP (natural resistance-associated macrophage protein)-like metal ion transporter